MKKIFQTIFLCFLMIPVVSCGSVLGEISYDEEIEYVEDVSEEPDAIEHEAGVYVSVVGGVKYPGVYILPKDSRVYEAINAAGGVTEEGDLSRLNLVDIMKDGQQIAVPFKKEYQPESGDFVEYGDIEVNGQKVDINSASYADLMTLSGIGESKAKAIVAFREKNGRFKTVEDLMKVSGIKEGTFEKIKDSIVAY